MGAATADVFGLYTVTTQALADGVHALSARIAGGAAPQPGPKMRVNTFTMGAKAQSSVAVLADGGFVVSWTSRSPPTPPPTASSAEPSRRRRRAPCPPR